MVEIKNTRQESKENEEKQEREEKLYEKSIKVVYLAKQ